MEKKEKDGKSVDIKVNQLISRFYESMYYRVSFYQNHFNEFMYRIGKSENDLGRFCSNFKESLNHIFFECTKLNSIDIQLECIKNNVSYDVKEIITNENVKLSTQLFLQKYFGEKK